MDRIDRFRIFTRVVECASFTRAADQLGLPRSTVSAAIAELEQRLGPRPPPPARQAAAPCRPAAAPRGELRIADHGTGGTVGMAGWRPAAHAADARLGTREQRRGLDRVLRGGIGAVADSALRRAGRAAVRRIGGG